MKIGESGQTEAKAVRCGFLEFKNASIHHQKLYLINCFDGNETCFEMHADVLRLFRYSDWQILTRKGRRLAKVETSRERFVDDEK